MKKIRIALIYKKISCYADFIAPILEAKEQQFS
jgi:hypothetical protein